MTSLHTGPDDPRPLDEGTGVRAAFDTALAALRPELLQDMRRRVGDPELAADLTQEALSRMMKYRDAPQIEDRRLMLFRIANNLVAEHHRTQGRHRAAHHVSLDAIGPLRADDPPAEAIADARQALDRLFTHTIADLPAKCRLAFMLSRFDGLSHRQVADRMGISVKMVEKHIARALVACRSAVGPRDE